MENITCIAIDDEPLALTVISNFCRRKGGISLQTYSEPRSGMEAIIRQHPDLVILDIQMNSINGLEIARNLPRGITLIFTTAHEKFALEGYELNAVDFLHKPYAYSRFEKAINKASFIIDILKARRQEETITVKQEYANVIIPVKEITYIQAMENYSKIFNRRGEFVLSHANMKTIEQMLPGQIFTRVHKSYIVSGSYISGYTKSNVTIELEDGQTSIPVGRKFQKEFEKFMDSRKGFVQQPDIKH